MGNFIINKKFIILRYRINQLKGISFFRSSYSHRFYLNACTSASYNEEQNRLQKAKVRLTE